VERGLEAQAEAALLEGLAELSLHTEPSQRQALLRLAILLERWAQRINLTAHRDRGAIVDRLILDAAALAVRLPETPSLVDLGSGAGFPGLPLAILRPDCRVLLIESRERRHHFQRAAIRELGLANVEALRGRAEQLAPRPAALAVAQAVAPPAQALAWMLPWVEIGGWIALPGGEQPPRFEPRPSLILEHLFEYTIPRGGPRRTLWLGRRTA
jgi:16S rRNA (guanine527-N7)-methyltransferase